MAEYTLASHTLQSPRERGSGELVYSESFCDRILSRPIRCTRIVFQKNNSLYASSLEIEGWTWFARLYVYHRGR